MFITFEGIDACGKTTQLKLLEATLAAQGIDFLSTRQPGGTRIGQLIRTILLDPENRQLVPEAEVLLYMADRIQHLQEVIIPALNQGRLVLCDRYHDATLAYQGGGRQLDLSWLEMLQHQAVRTPDLTLWFDISVETSQQRLQTRNREQNTENCRLESENAAFFRRIRDRYRELSHREPGRFVVISAENDIATVQQEVQEVVNSRLKHFHEI